MFLGHSLTYPIENIYIYIYIYIKEIYCITYLL